MLFRGALLLLLSVPATALNGREKRTTVLDFTGGTIAIHTRER